MVFSGGGTHGITYVNAYKTLRDYAFLRNIDLKKQIIGYGGTSAGAIFCFLLLLGLTDQEIWNAIVEYDQSQLIVKQVNISTFLTKWGFHDKTNIREFYGNIMELKGFSRDISFIDFYKKTKKSFVLSVTNLSKKDVEYHSFELTPNFKVLDSIMASVSIPILFCPEVRINPKTKEKEYLLDGGLVDNTPVLFPIHETFVFTIPMYGSKIEGIVSFYKNLMGFYIDMCCKRILSNLRKKKACMFSIRVHGIESLRLNITQKQKACIAGIGSEAMHLFLHKDRLTSTIGCLLILEILNHLSFTCSQNNQHNCQNEKESSENIQENILCRTLAAVIAVVVGCSSRVQFPG